MNTFVRNVHRFLYGPPASKVTMIQRGSYAGSNPADCYEWGRLPFNAWKTMPLYPPGKGASPGDEYDTTGGEMTRSTGPLLGLRAPEDGLYAVTFGGVIDTNGEANNVHFRLGRNIATDSQWGTGYGAFASHCPGRAQHASDGMARFIGSIATTINLKKGDMVSASGVADKDFILGRRDVPGRSFLEMRWVGRAP
ncbi:hypothetical protein [Streptomyces sp. NPDC018045]|uniref:hypothetical protein n=1 Tax=Streptomyces sp. NPDC018045 TaxID=3365037 RepID=UPI0037942284